MQNLKELIKLSGIKQSVIARELGVSQPVVSYWSTGKQSPTIENAIALANLFNVSVGCIVDTEPIPEGYPDIVMISTQASLMDKIQNSKKSLHTEKTTQQKQTVNIDPDQLAAIEARITKNVIDALKEDTSLLKNKDA